MGAQEHTERVLRDIHVLFSKAEPFNGSKMNVVVNKNDMMELLKELNECMYDMMDEHELSARKKEKANRDMQKQGDDIIFEASRKAEDVYAASIMYTDNALNQIQDIMKQANDAIEQIYTDTKVKLEEEHRQVKKNQLELKAQLGDMIDTQKYLHLIEEENRRLQQMKDKKSDDGYYQEDAPAYASVQPEIRINKDYFINNGIPLDEAEETTQEANENLTTLDQLSEEELAAMSQDLDNEYFDWKEDGENTNQESEHKGFNFLGKLIKNS